MSKILKIKTWIKINSNLVSLVPLVIPIPLIFLGLFTSGIQALIFATLSGSLWINKYKTQHIKNNERTSYWVYKKKKYLQYIGEAMEGHH